MYFKYYTCMPCHNQYVRLENADTDDKNNDGGKGTEHCADNPQLAVSCLLFLCWISAFYGTTEECSHYNASYT